MQDGFDFTIVVLLILVILAFLFLIICIKTTRNKKRKTSKKDNSLIKQSPSASDVSTEPEFSVSEPEFPVYPNQDTDIPADSYIYNDNHKIIGRADGKPLNDADAAYIMREGYKHAKDYYENHPNPELHRTPDELEASYQFTTKWGNASSKKCDVFLNLAEKAFTETDTDKKIELLQDAISAFYSAKEWHYAKTEGGKIYFQDMWEYMNNSQNACFSWADVYQKQITDILYERDVIVPWIVENAKTGFVQTAIYKAFPKQEQDYLRKIITSLVTKGIIKKEKKGNSYFVYS